LAGSEYFLRAPGIGKKQGIRGGKNQVSERLSGQIKRGREAKEIILKAAAGMVGGATLNATLVLKRY